VQAQLLAMPRAEHALCGGICERFSGQPVR
jgi:hypothetical protein